MAIYRLKLLKRSSKRGRFFFYTPSVQINIKTDFHDWEFAKIFGKRALVENSAGLVEMKSRQSQFWTSLLYRIRKHLLQARF